MQNSSILFVSNSDDKHCDKHIAMTPSGRAHFFSYCILTQGWHWRTILQSEQYNSTFYDKNICAYTCEAVKLLYRHILYVVTVCIHHLFYTDEKEQWILWTAEVAVETGQRELMEQMAVRWPCRLPICSSVTSCKSQPYMCHIAYWH